MIQIKVNVTDTASPAIREIASALTGQEMENLNAVGGRSASNAATKWHREFSRVGGWKGKRYMQSSLGRSGEFGENVASGWSFRTSDTGGATIGNNADHYAFKVRGGTIRPKRVSWLTIPLIPDAKGRRAKDYEIDFNTRLFRPKGKNALMERIAGGGVRGVYALVKSVTQNPMPEALPPEDVIGDAFVEGWRNALIDKIERL